MVQEVSSVITSAVQTAGYRISMFNIFNLSPGCDIVRSTLGETLLCCRRGAAAVVGWRVAEADWLSLHWTRLAAARSLDQSERRVSGGSTNHRPACSCIQGRKAALAGLAVAGQCAEYRQGLVSRSLHTGHIISCGSCRSHEVEVCRCTAICHYTEGHHQTCSLLATTGPMAIYCLSLAHNLDTATLSSAISHLWSFKIPKNL